MTIQYFGVSCFKFTTKLGNEEVSLVTDPFSSKVGKLPRNLAGDILTVSRRTHDHHNNAGAASGEKTFLMEHPGEYEVKGVPVYGIPADHEKKETPGYHRNTIFQFIMDEMRVVHLGGSETPLTDEQLAQLGEVDILLIPVGGGDVMNGAAAADLVARMEPRVVIPMHYKEGGLALKADGPEKFMKEAGLKPETAEKLKLMKKDLPQEETRLFVLNMS